jgi:hypothetical protein
MGTSLTTSSWRGKNDLFKSKHKFTKKKSKEKVPEVLVFHNTAA